MSYRTKDGLYILMADDSEDDAFFVKRALEQSQVSDFFYAVPDGLEALAYLRRQGEYSDQQRFPFPNVLLCDLKMPRMDGFGVLRWLQQHPECKVIPTVVFTSSALEQDIHQSYVLGANAYLQKPGSLNEMTETMRRLYEFWSHCQVPQPPQGDRCQ